MNKGDPLKNRTSDTPRVAIISEGGGLKAAWVSGVIQYLVDETEFTSFSLLAGSSSSIIPMSYLCAGSQYISRNMNIWKEILRCFPPITVDLFMQKKRKEFLDYKQLIDIIRNSDYGLNYSAMSSSLSNLAIPLSDFRTGDIVWYSKFPLKHINSKTIPVDDEDFYFNLVLASIVVPLPIPLMKVPSPVLIEDNYYCDGGFNAPIPSDPIIEDEFDNIIVITTKPKNYIRKNYLSNNFTGFRHILASPPNKLLERRSPQFSRLMANWNTIDSRLRSALQGKSQLPKYIWIYPQEKIDLDIRRRPYEIVSRYIDIGNNDAKVAYDKYQEGDMRATG